MTCMNCVHWNVCEWVDNDECVCSDFKDKDEFVAVVRCKDCKHSRAIDKNKSPEKYFREDCVVCTCEDVVGDEPAIYLPIHFCSYGEKSDI